MGFGLTVRALGAEALGCIIMVDISFDDLTDEKVMQQLGLLGGMEIEFMRRAVARTLVT